MASGSMKREISETHDTLRFGLNAGVKADLAPPHPLQSSIQSEAKFWADKKKFGTEAIYGSALNIRKDLDAQILSRFQRPPGALPSSLLGYEALTGSLDDFGFEDYLNMPQDSEGFRQPDMHHGMEVRLGLSKGPICPSFS
ncbi:putative proteasome maturation factor UMP1 family protein [Zea mays]|uniref:Proteasome maturation factor UMP1 n=1 Tax=Zea mays TaxID=4577 RepID=B4FLC7_MAIZE|nr:putative proteasome maturation factor UMP1 family protein [Zea mays]ACF82920.1 unknown [Zea mays]ACG24555.1 proteasome maturation factor UMP1 family protein [Zea mays]ACG30994.1 proteasome maturation factor UMP1 family protein [Zea mays]AQK75870.1 Proteasome maturation factor UMP1 [Zea mays]AQK75872.1 Proteasome maturation factor UMP1 [Zea mays]|eukprot:NP_001136932.1 putative proteasome maturation factor UMP1 family protein [Zea mays]